MAKIMTKCLVLVTVLVLGTVGSWPTFSLAQTKFLSDIDPVYRELERRQRLEYVTGAGQPRYVPPWRNAAEMRATLQAFSAQLDTTARFPGEIRVLAEEDWREMERELSGPLPTRYENPKFYIMLKMMSGLIRRASQNLSLDISHEPRFGSLPIPGLNAEVLQISGSQEHLVIFNGGVFDNVRNLSQLLTQTVEVTFDEKSGNVYVDHTDEKFRERLAAHPEIKLNLVRLLRFYAGKDKEDPRFVTVSANHRLLSSIDRAMYLFILGHEYGHAIKKHSPINIGASDVEGLARSWMQELEADRVGLQLMAKVMELSAKESAAEELKLGYHLMAPLLLLEYVRVNDEAAYIMKYGRRPPPLGQREEQEALALLEYGRRGNSLPIAERPPSSVASRFNRHPPTWLRWSILGSEIETRLRVLPTYRQKEWAVIARSLGQNLQVLWDQAAPIFVERTR